MEISFKNVKPACKSMVDRYRSKSKDNRLFPEFLLRGLSEGGWRGHIHFYWKTKDGKVIISEERVTYNSIPELNILIENLGNAWERTNAKYRLKQKQAARVKIAS